MPALDYSQLAEFYDALVAFEDDVPFFLDLCRGVNGPVLELMSGTGRVSLPLIEAGVELTCVDGSRDMLVLLEDKLRTRGLAAEVIERDVRCLNLGKSYDLVFLPFHSFAELIEPEDREAALKEVFECLNPGGRFVCTLHNPTVRLRSALPNRAEPPRFTVPGRAGEFSLDLKTKHDPTTGLVEGVEIIREHDEAGNSTEIRRIPIRFVMIEADDFRVMAEQAGFHVEKVFGDYRGGEFVAESSPYMIWILRAGS